MMNRREFTTGVVTTLAAPYVLKTRLHAQSTRLRRDVTKLDPSDPLLGNYAQAVKAMHDDLPANDPRNWRNQALIHINHCMHGARDFPHWHRHYLANFELICGDLIGDPSFALPYWNWTENRGRIPDPFFDLDGLNVAFWKDPSNAQSDHWDQDTVQTVGRRNLIKGQGLQDDPQRGGSFTKQRIAGIQALSNYNLWAFSLEGSPHNDGHVVVGAGNGHMGNGMSPLDPIFWLHHCNIDRLWAQWQAAGNTTPPLSSTYDGQFVDANKQPVMATSANALNIAGFNYTYDVLTGPVVARESQDLNLESFRHQKVLSPEEVSSAPQTLGATTEAKPVKTNVETAFTVTIADLVPNLFKSRTFWAPEVLGVPRLAAEPSRMVARLTDVSAPKEAAPIIVNVFVNCPYLSPETGWNDPHYAGSFSFFGPHQDEFIVDITEPLRALSADGRIATNDVKIQLMPISVDPNVTAETTFTVGKVEVLRV